MCIRDSVISIHIYSYYANMLLIIIIVTNYRALMKKPVKNIRTSDEKMSLKNSLFTTHV